VFYVFKYYSKLLFVSSFHFFPNRVTIIYIMLYHVSDFQHTHHTLSKTRKETQSRNIMSDISDVEYMPAQKLTNEARR